MHQDRQWDDNFFVQGSLQKDFTKWYSLLLNGKYAYDYLRYLSDPRLDVTTMYVDNRYRQQEAYFSAAQRFKPFYGLSVEQSGCRYARFRISHALVGIWSCGDGL